MILLLRDVYKSFGEVRALDGLSLEFGGGVLGFIGPNGAGKTTTINIVSGFIRPDNGVVRVFDLDPWSERAEVFSRMGVMPDEIVFPGWLTGYQLLKVEAQAMGLGDYEGRILELARMVGIDWALGMRVGGYSTGMFKRLLMARTLLNPDVDLYILDEPFSNVDVESIITFVGLIRELSRSGKSFIIASHILPHLLPICDNFVFIRSGRIVASGGFRELLSRLDRFHYLLRLDGDVEGLVEGLSTIGGVEEYHIDELGLHIFLRDPRKSLMDVLELCRDLGVSVWEFSLYPDPLTQVFFRLGGGDEA